MELEGKSAIHFFRKFGTDHDKDLVNYKKIKESILSCRVELSEFRKSVAASLGATTLTSKSLVKSASAI